jgi:hypothetical protein
VSEAEPETGWRVLDPDGNVVASGPATELEMAAEMGEALNLEGSDGGD